MFDCLDREKFEAEISAMHESWKPTVDGAIEWGELMDAEIAKGASVFDAAEKTSHKACIGWSGFQFGYAKNILIKHWRHGAELQRIRDRLW